MKARRIGTLFLVALAGALPFLASCTQNPHDVMDLLSEGNLRFAEDDADHPRQDEDRRYYVATKGQYPVATVLAPSDSRVPVELLFDAGVGDLFVVRVMGNVAMESQVLSAEYGVERLSTPLVVVLGNTACEIVSAAAGSTHVQSGLGPFVEKVAPAVARAREKHPDLQGAAFLREAVKENVFQSIEDLLESSSLLRNKARMAKIALVGAVYDIGAGKVEWLGKHPDQERLIREAAEKETESGE